MALFKIENRYRNLLGYIKDNRFRLYGAMFCMLITSVSTAATAYLVRPVIDKIFVAHDASMLKLIPLAVIAVAFLQGLGMYGQEVLLIRVAQGIIKEFRDRLYARITTLPLAFFHEKKTGVLMSRITNDIQLIKSVVAHAITYLVRDVFTLIGLLCVTFYQIWQLAFVAFVVLPLLYYPIAAIGRKVRRISRRSQTRVGDINSFLHETFVGNKIIKAFGREEYEIDRFYEKSAALFDIEMKNIKTKALTSPIVQVLSGLGVALVIWFGGSQVMSGVYTSGQFLSFLAAVMLMYAPLKRLSSLNAQVQQGMAAVDRVYEILEVQSDIVEAPDAVEIKGRHHRVTFDKVDFSYNGQEQVLTNIDLDVAPGEVIAIVGASGGGKTTLVNLIPRFYDVSSGAVLVDGLDIRQATIASLRKQIAIVTQEPILFNDTIRANIAYGNPDASEEDIIRAAKDSYTYDFAMRFPEQLDTVIGELGARLSGGQKQRLCIARALIKDAPILILDEATSSLDTEAEAIVQKALANLMKGRTTFVIAHRLSTVSHADRVIVISNGKISEQGKHDELLALGGDYYRLCQMQFKNGG